MFVFTDVKIWVGKELELAGLNNVSHVKTMLSQYTSKFRALMGFDYGG